MTSRRPRRAPRPPPAPPAVELSLVALAENNRQLTAELVQRRAASVALSGAVRALKRRLIAATSGPTVADASTQTAPPSPPSASTSSTSSPSTRGARSPDASPRADDESPRPSKRRARRTGAQGVVSYAEPSLKAKMRRPRSPS